MAVHEHRQPAPVADRALACRADLAARVPRRVPEQPRLLVQLRLELRPGRLRTAVQAYISLGWAEPGAKKTPVENRWWLDVETANSWRENTSRNVSALRGAVAYLERVGVRSIGFYSAPHMWTDITGGTRTFAGYPSWVAGASTLNGAKHRCAGSGFTGGGVWLTQFFKSGFDANYAC